MSVDGDVDPDTGWYHRHPGPFARRISDHVAFRNGARIEGDVEARDEGTRRRATRWRAPVDR